MKKLLYPNGHKIIAQIQKLAKEFGEPATRWAVKKWDSGMRDRKRLLRQKQKLMQDLKKINKSPL